MAKRGRPPKPLAQRRLEGNPGRRPLPDEPKLTASTSTFPSWMPEYGKELWEQIVPLLRREMKAVSIDDPALVGMCLSWGFAMQAAKRLKREGLIKAGAKNPLTQVWRDNLKSFYDFASKFGMTPSDRARLMTDLLVGEKPATTGEGVLNGDWTPETTAVNKPN